MQKIKLTTCTEDDFFAHGRKMAKLADKGLPIPKEKIFRFEDPAELARLVTERRINLIREIKKNSGTVSQISTALGRSRSSIKRDIDMLEHKGILSVTTLKVPGERVKKLVQVTANEISLWMQII